MNYSSVKADRNTEERKESREYLFMSVYSADKAEEVACMFIGKQLQELTIMKDSIGKKDIKQIYKIFRSYIKTKNMKIQELKKPHEVRKHVDKICIEENNLIDISVVENKIPSMGMYYTTRFEEFKEDFQKFYSNQKSLKKN